jgi:hypothetical protein
METVQPEAIIPKEGAICLDCQQPVDSCPCEFANLHRQDVVVIVPAPSEMFLAVMRKKGKK